MTARGGKEAGARAAARPAAERRPPTDRRIAERRKAIAAARVRRRRRQLGGLLLAAALAVGVAELARSPLFGLQSVKVSGAGALSRADVVAAAGVHPGQPYLGIDLAEVRRRVARLPRVAEVRVTRAYPASLRIEIVERVPAATLRAAGRWWLVTADGVVVDAAATRPPAMPYVAHVPLPAAMAAGTRLPAGNPLANALAALGGMRPELAGQVTGVAARSLDGLELRLRDGARVLYGLGGAQPAQAPAVLLVRRQLAKEGRRLVRIDVRTPSTPTVVATGEPPNPAGEPGKAAQR
jgi:cell division protein FtsQ